MSSATTAAGAWSSTPTLRGRLVTLEPLRAGHSDGLRAASADGDLSALWYANVPGPDDVDRFIATALSQRDAGRDMPFVVRDASGDIVGTTRYYDLAADVPRLNIGYTWYASRAQRSGLNVEAKTLLLGHAFDVLGCIAVGFETSWFNHASREAIARLGAKQDGVLRGHKRHADGSIRDTVVFSILQAEWPAVRIHLARRLAGHV
jgi:RimJ/RimL family protein N-acetyltransferase